MLKKKQKRTLLLLLLLIINEISRNKVVVPEGVAGLILIISQIISVSWVFIYAELLYRAIRYDLIIDYLVVDNTKYQRDAFNIIYSSNILLYMFRVSSTHLQEEQLYVSSIWYRHSL